MELKKSIENVKKTLVEHGLYNDCLVRKALDLTVDFEIGRRGEGMNWARDVTYHSLSAMHVNDVLKYSLDNLGLYPYEIISQDIGLKRNVAIASLTHDWGYFVNDSKIDYGTMKIAHEEKSKKLLRALADSGNLWLEKKDLEDVCKIIDGTVVNGPLTLKDKRNPIDVAAVMVGAADVLGAGKNYLRAIPGLYLEFKRDKLVLDEYLSGDLTDDQRQDAQTELGKIEGALARTPIDQIANSKFFFEKFVDPFRLNQVEEFINARGWADENRRKINAMFNFQGEGRNFLAERYGLADSLEKVNEIDKRCLNNKKFFK